MATTTTSGSSAGMAAFRNLSTAQIIFQVSGGPLDQFEVIRFRGSEGMCQLYRFEIELASADGSVAFDAVVGKPAVLSINSDQGERWFHGIVSRFEMTGETHEQTHFRAELVPALWLLTHRYNSRIFQNQTVPEIINDILEKGGIASDRIRSTLNRTYKSREYCVQYRETDYNFICRLMEEEGIRWYFEQKQDAHILVMEDSPSYEPIEGDANLPYHPPTGLNVEQDHVFRFRMAQSVRPGAVVLNDFNFENPKLKLESKCDAGRDTGLEFSDYPGEYLQQSDGSTLAKLRAEEFESGRIYGVGQSNCRRLAVGRTFSMIEHPSEPTNDSYLLVSICHEGKQSGSRGSTGAAGRSSILDSNTHQSLLVARGQDGPIRDLADALLQIVSRLNFGDPTAHRALTQWLYHAGQVSRELTSAAGASGGNPLEALAIPNLIDDLARAGLVDVDAPTYSCRFQCIPATVSYRPPRVTPWPMMRGTQTARVVGPQGEEIYTDKYGRVKVQFNWDREGKFDENSSCWIRVSQGSAGGQYGIMFLPRVGQEVVVDFLEGDPDKPLITGRVYNADQMPPYALPDEKSKSVIKTHSTKGGGGTNEIRFEDLKGKEQILVYAQKDLHVRVKNDRVETIQHDQHLTVNSDKFELIKKSKDSEVKLDLSEKIGGKKSLLVTGDVAENFKANHSEKVGNSLYLKAGMNVVIEAGVNLTLKVGGNFVTIDPSGVTIMGTLVKINSGGSAGNGTAATLKAPEKPAVADKVKAGKNVTYSGGQKLAAATTPADLAGYEFVDDEIEEKKTSWIEIELVDEAGQPVPNEAFEITAPDGTTIRRGSLNADGQAHVEVPEAGNYQIAFPNLDKDAWEKL